MKRKLFLLAFLFFMGALVFNVACSNLDSASEGEVTEIETISEQSSSDVSNGDVLESSESVNEELASSSSEKEELESSSSEKEDLETDKFKVLCESTGGSEKDGVCVCQEELCDVGALCNTETGECSNKKESVVSECDDSYVSTCENSGKGIGIVKECIKGVLVNRSCGLASCNEEATDCGECIDNVQTCSEDKKFHATVTRCEKGKIVTESCGDFSCDPRDNGCGECTNYGRSCINDDEEKGTIYECIAGEAKKVVTKCGNKSCRTDKVICGECLNGELRCDNDKNNNAVMYRCVNGQWERLRNKFDPLDEDYKKCNAWCLPTAEPEDKEYCHDVGLCTDDCDPCAGVDYDEDLTAPNSNPCYNAERCKQILAEEDPAYPPFRDTYAKNKWRTLIPEEKMAVKTITGYNWKNNAPKIEDRVGPFEFDLTNETGHVSCNAAGTYFGKCHNSLQACINKDYHTEGFMVVCSNGDLVDLDGNNDGIACECEKTPNNANGLCYSRSTCFKQTNWDVHHCARPMLNEDDD